MIVGDGTTAAYTRKLFGEVPWLWICQDITTDDDGIPDTVSALLLAHELITQSGEANIVLSTQFPVGTCAAFEERYPDKCFAVIPENFRTTQRIPTVDRIVVGTRSEPLWRLINDKLYPPMILMYPESAEMVKHAINGFLALSIQYAHEIERLAKIHGASPKEVAQGLQSDTRIGEASYLKPEGTRGLHLTREVHNLFSLGGGPLIDVLEATCWPS